MIGWGEGGGAHRATKSEEDVEALLEREGSAEDVESGDARGKMSMD